MKFKAMFEFFEILNYLEPRIGEKFALYIGFPLFLLLWASVITFFVGIIVAIVGGFFLAGKMMGGELVGGLCAFWGLWTVVFAVFWILIRGD